jgi:hypothetical protein
MGGTYDYAIEMGLGVIMYVLNFINRHSKFDRGDTLTDT